MSYFSYEALMEEVFTGIRPFSVMFSILRSKVVVTGLPEKMYVALGI